MNEFPKTPQISIDIDERDPDRSLDQYETEVQLAIAQFVIRRVAGTPAGLEIFDALLPRFQDRLFYHKLLAHYLTAPEHIGSDEDSDD